MAPTSEPSAWTGWEAGKKTRTGMSERELERYASKGKSKKKSS